MRGLRKTVRKRLLAKLKELKEEFRGRWQEPVAELGQWLRSVVQGYFKLPRRAREPSQSQQFSAGGEQALVRALRRRGQKHPMTWARFAPLIEPWLPIPQILHPYPNLHFNAKYLR